MKRMLQRMDILVKVNVHRNYKDWSLYINIHTLGSKLHLLLICNQQVCVAEANVERLLVKLMFIM